MIKRFRPSMAAALLIAPAAILWSAPAANLVLQSESRIWVTGTSTVRGYECAAGVVNATVAAAAGAEAALLAGQKAVTAVTVTIPSAELDCDNGTMNEHMHKAINVSEHEQIRFRLASYELTPGAAATTARLTGTLELNGVSKQISLDANVSDAGGAVKVSGTHQLLMSEYGVRPPRLMLGTLKVHDPVVVHFDLLLKS